MGLPKARLVDKNAHNEGNHAHYYQNHFKYGGSQGAIPLRGCFVVNWAATSKKQLLVDKGDAYCKHLIKKVRCEFIIRKTAVSQNLAAIPNIYN